MCNYFKIAEMVFKIRLKLGTNLRAFTRRSAPVFERISSVTCLQFEQNMARRTQHVPCSPPCVLLCVIVCCLCYCVLLVLLCFACVTARYCVLLMLLCVACVTCVTVCSLCYCALLCVACVTARYCVLLVLLWVTVCCLCYCALLCVACVTVRYCVLLMLLCVTCVTVCCLCYCALLCVTLCCLFYCALLCVACVTVRYCVLLCVSVCITMQLSEPHHDLCVASHFWTCYLPRDVQVLHRPTVVCSAVRRWVIAFVFTDALKQPCLIIFKHCRAQEHLPRQKTVLSFQSVSSSSSHIWFLPPPTRNLPHPYLHRLVHRSFLAFTHRPNMAFFTFFRSINSWRWSNYGRFETSVRTNPAARSYIV